MVIGILNFGDGLLGLAYIVFCTVASLGVVQIAASQARLVGLLFWPAPISRWLGLALVVGAFIWFFASQPDLFIPELAGGELFSLFLFGFAVAVLLALGLGILASRFSERRSAHAPPRREPLVLRGQVAELWLPHAALPPLGVALREADTDSLDVLSGELVAGGSAILLCHESLADAALEWAALHREQFHPTHRYVIGVGRGADRALALAAQSSFFQAVVALAPFGRTANARPGLRWLGETDYLTAFRATRHTTEIQPVAPPPNARVIYGDEDLLIPPNVARELYPNAIMVAGARHLTLAAMPAVLRLTADLCQVRLRDAVAAQPHAAAVSRAHGEAGE